MLISKSESAARANRKNSPSLRLLAKSEVEKLARKELYLFLHDDLRVNVTQPARTACKSPANCVCARQIGLQINYDHLTGPVDLSHLWMVLLDVRENEYHYCDECREEDDRLIMDGLETIWQRLPETFGLPPWDEMLEDEKDACDAKE